ncbi:elongation factor P [Paraburkholderia sp. CNPSo 3281]|uniref:elongation factor P n=1 Tax=Paraburkholderia sp. CNPSo 3281 TaxID=2940933 RepID=UPI0020B643CE|nr:elongation factor P [Paraburkholderia sp. CNPSo 3281]MCP3715404.1 elongation factor P [Paraburkholderia sp. CNPSo 3281]
MVEASGLKPGMVVMLEGELHSVASAGYHAGGGQQGSAVFARVKNLKTGHIRELRLHPSDRLEEVALDHKEMEYLYTDGVAFYFMDPDTFEQISLSSETIGAYEKFLQPNMRIPVALNDGEPVTIAFPHAVELGVVSAPLGVHEHATSTFKTATLENGMEVLVPQFIKEGDTVRIEVASGKYVERVRREMRKP